MYELRAINLRTSNDRFIRNIDSRLLDNAVSFDNWSDSSNFYYGAKIYNCIDR